MGLKKYKEKLILIGGTIGIGFVSLVITLTVYNVQVTNMKQDSKLKLKEDDEIVFNAELTEAQKVVAQNIIAELEKIEKTSQENKNTSADLKSEEIINESESQDDDYVSVKNDDSTIKSVNNDNSNVDNNVEEGSNSSDVNNNKKQDVNTENEDVVVPTVALLKKDMSFIRPVEGTLGMIFSDEKLVYSKTLDEWITHKGIDFIASEDTAVKASADGIVTDLFDDERYGFTITIEHDNGYISKYSGVKQDDLVKLGDRVKRGRYYRQIS